jgi:glycosyltransferase involved in cell wall biosynthesis
MFGRWAAAQLARERWDVVHSWSGVSEEILQASAGTGSLNLVMRGSAHIRVQARLLEEEEKRAAQKLDRPTPWILAREEREYRLADRIVVLSTFARDSFVDLGIDPEKLAALPLGASVQTFRPSPEVVEARCRRIRSGDPLRVLYVGTLSLRKGLADLIAVIRRTEPRQFQFRLVGPVAAEANRLVAGFQAEAEFVPKQRQQDLPHSYDWADLFVFPTLEDGYAVVLAQAHAAALPLLTTANCCGPDLIREGATGWVLPIRSPQAFIERLRWCDTHRADLAGMVEQLYHCYQPRDWADVAADFEALCLTARAGLAGVRA